MTSAVNSLTSAALAIAAAATQSKICTVATRIERIVIL
jgi:hypothetical protein